MGKHPQNSFRRLMIVGHNESQARRQPARLRWWGPRRPVIVSRNREANRPTREQWNALRMAVMPTLSRGLWFEVIAWLVSFVRSHWFTRKRKGPAVVLPFRRSGMALDFVAKKASGSVSWSSDREFASKEGGRA
jgi:hypothetical protein